MADNGHFCVLILFLGAGYKSVKIALIQLILNDTVLLKLAFRKGFCNGGGDLSFISQNLCIVELQKSVQLGGQSAMVIGICRLAAGWRSPDTW